MWNIGRYCWCCGSMHWVLTIYINTPQLSGTWDVVVLVPSVCPISSVPCFSICSFIIPYLLPLILTPTFYPSTAIRIPILLMTCLNKFAFLFISYFKKVISPPIFLSTYSFFTLSTHLISSIFLHIFISNGSILALSLFPIVHLSIIYSDFYYKIIYISYWLLLFLLLSYPLSLLSYSNLQSTLYCFT